MSWRLPDFERASVLNLVLLYHKLYRALQSMVTYLVLLPVSVCMEEHEPWLTTLVTLLMMLDSAEMLEENCTEYTGLQKRLSRVKYQCIARYRIALLPLLPTQ